MKSNYVCEKCGLSVILHDGKIIRACTHNESNVIARIRAAAFGKGTSEARKPFKHVQ